MYLVVSRGIEFSESGNDGSCLFGITENVRDGAVLVNTLEKAKADREVWEIIKRNTNKFTETKDCL